MKTLIILSVLIFASCGKNESTPNNVSNNSKKQTTEQSEQPKQGFWTNTYQSDVDNYSIKLNKKVPGENRQFSDNTKKACEIETLDNAKAYMNYDSTNIKSIIYELRVIDEKQDCTLYLSTGHFYALPNGDYITYSNNDHGIDMNIVGETLEINL